MALLIISGSLSKRVRNLTLWCEEFRKEIEWWFNLRDKAPYPQNIALRKPICIELYEFANYLCWLYATVNKIVALVNKMYVEAGRNGRLSFVNRGVVDIARSWKNHLRTPRNVIAAHRYTDKGGRFLTLSNVIRSLNLLGWDKLEEAWRDLSKVHNELETWLSNPINKNHLVLADGLAKRKQSKR